MQKNVLVGVTGGIAAFKVLELIKSLVSKNINVFVVMTRAGASIVPPEEFEKASGNKVYLDLFEKGFDYREVLEKRKVEHIELAGKADLIVVAPASANTLAKLAHGFADDLLSTIISAATCPVLLCPSMNVFMWKNPATQKNLSILQKFGYGILHPDSGMLACGYEGVGRLAAIEKIDKEIEIYLYKTEQLKGKKYIVTAGGTAEKIDDVRFIANKSSGKMGAALAESLYVRGAEVLFVCSENSVQPRFAMPIKTFETVHDLKNILQHEIPEYDGIFHAAAVSDFSLKESLSGKITSDKELQLTLTPQEKLISLFKKWNPNIHVVGFKAVWNLTDAEIIQKAQEKLKESSADVIVANDVGKKERGFGSDTNEVFIVDTKGRTEKNPLASKREVAEKIVDFVLHL